MGLRVQLLGEFKVWRDGQLIEDSEWRTRSVTDLFKILVIEPGKARSSDELMELLWPEAEPEKAMLNLRNRVSTLRRVLEPGLSSGRESSYILTDHGSYCFNHSADLHVDTQEFSKLHAEGFRLQESGQLRRAIRSLEKGRDLYRGDLLPLDRYAEWVLPYRESYHDTYLDILWGLANCYAQTGECSKAVESCESLLQQDSANEEAYRLLMACHYLLGNHGKAMEAYRDCARRLEELGAKPSKLTEQLRADIETKPTDAKRLPSLRSVLPHVARIVSSTSIEDLKHSLDYTAYAAERAADKNEAAEVLRFAEDGLALADEIKGLSSSLHMTKERFALISQKVRAHNLLGERDQEAKCIEQLFELANRAGSPELLAEAEIRRSKLHLVTSEFEHAYECAKRALENYEQCKDLRGQGDALNNMGYACRQLGRYEEASELYGLALDIRERLDDKKGAGQTLNNLGTLAQELGDYEKALECYERASDYFRQIEDWVGAGTTLLNSGVTSRVIGEFVQAAEKFKEALELFEEVEDKEGMAFVLSNIGTLHMGVGRYSEAQHFLESGLKLRRELSEALGQAITLNDLGVVYLEQGSLDEAFKSLSDAVEKAREGGRPYWEAIALDNLGRCHLAAGKNDEALNYFNRAAELAAVSDLPHYLSLFTAHKAEAQLRLELLDGASAAVDQALSAIDCVEQPKDRAEIYYVAYRVKSYVNQTSESREWLEKAYSTVLEWAERIKEARFRESLLNNVPLIREIVFQHEMLTGNE